MPVLNFKGKTAVENYHYTIPHHTLEFDEKLSVLDKGQKPSLDGNLIVEGDNLIALKALLPTHAGRIKCIYIDPPYNTGNEGWVYNDNLTQPQFKEWIGQTVGKEAEDASRHDKWSCMMYPRLQLLRELLRDDGAIFISIDDNELHNLRSLMDEIFGQENFVATIIWEKVYSPKSSARHFSENHDYIVVYARNKESWTLNLLPRGEEQNARYSNPDNDPRGPWTSADISARNFYSKGTYSITCPGGRKIPGPPPGSYWRISKEKFESFKKDKRIYWGSDLNQVPRIKRFLSEVKQGLVPETIWTYKEVGHTQEAKKEYLQILEGVEVFTTPKPTALVKRIIALATEPGDIVLDSFAGSGTTGQAVLELNADDNGRRNFVLIQQPFDSKENENKKFNICREITAQRIRNVITGYSFTGKKSKTIFEEKLTLKHLRKAPDILGDLDRKKESLAKEFDEIKLELKDGKLALVGISNIKSKTKGLGGEFTYSKLGKPLMNEYRTFGGTRPSYVELAKYIFYTETNQHLAGVPDSKSAKIGEYGGTSYFLLYEAREGEEGVLSLRELSALESSESSKNWVIYCEKIWVHRDDREAFEKRTGRSIRVMQLPFHLK